MIDLSPIVDQIFADEHSVGSFHDAITEATDVDNYTTKELKDIFLHLPFDIQILGLQWGLSDTPFRDEVYTHIMKAIQCQK